MPLAAGDGLNILLLEPDPNMRLPEGAVQMTKRNRRPYCLSVSLRRNSSIIWR
jgi:hypothetical protein